jgi:hypothetical protein
MNESKIQAAINAYGENFHFEFRLVGTIEWYRSAHPARSRSEAEVLVSRLNAADKHVVYRYRPWDGD